MSFTDGQSASLSARPAPGRRLGSAVTSTRPGDLQPASRLVHIAHGFGEHPPTHYLCGAPIRWLIGVTKPGHGPRGGGVCPVCARMDATVAPVDGSGAAEALLPPGWRASRGQSTDQRRTTRIVAATSAVAESDVEDSDSMCVSEQRRERRSNHARWIKVLLNRRLPTRAPY